MALQDRAHGIGSEKMIMGAEGQSLTGLGRVYIATHAKNKFAFDL